MLADPCRTVVRAEKASAEPDVREQGINRQDRRFPTRLIRISGKDLDDEFLSDNIVSVNVEETARGLGTAVVTLLNRDLKFTDNDLFQTGSRIEIYTGYRSSRFVKRGSYILAKPVFLFRGSPIVELHCYSEEWPLMVSEERRVYVNRRDSEIAAIIAQRYGLTADVDRTSPIHEHTMQANTSDMLFLEDRARLHGFDVYVSEGVLHFHAPRFVDSELSLFYGSSEVSQLASFQATVDPWRGGHTWTRSGMDRLSGAEWSYTSRDQQDGVAQTIVTKSKSRFQRAGDIASIDGRRPRRFIVGEGHEQSEDEGREQVRAFNQATDWIVHGMGELVGVERLKARQLIEIVGVGHLAGLYYVTRVRHTLKAGYSMMFEAVRPGTGSLTANASPAGANGPSSREPVDATSRSPRVGTVQVGP